MLERHPRVAQVWCHAGISRRVRPQEHVRLLESPQRPMTTCTSICPGSSTTMVVGSDRWREVVARHPERFVLGSDSFGDLEPQPGLLSRWTLFTDALPAVARRLVEHGNARRLWWAFM